MTRPKISVVMPVWNGEKHLHEAVESVLHQTFSDFEFIILDDGSTDDTPSIIHEYAAKDSRIRAISLEHEGIVVALNHGVSVAKSDWIARMDCDDISHPERFAKQWAAIKKNPHVVLCHTQIKMIGENKYIKKSPYLVRSHSLLKLRLCHQCPISHPSVLFRKKIFNAVGGYRPEERHAEDYALWGRMAEQGTFLGIPQTLLQFRVHSNSISKKNLERQKELGTEIALKHCENFMRLEENETKRALNTLRAGYSKHHLRDWFWLLYHCIPRLDEKSLELWMWALKQTLKRLTKGNPRKDSPNKHIY